MPECKGKLITGYAFPFNEAKEVLALAYVLMRMPNHATENDPKIPKIDHNNMLRTFNTTNKLFNNYATVEYVTFNKKYTVKAKIVPNSDVKNKVFFEVPRNITDASSIDLIVDFRDEKFEIALKEKAKSV